MLVKLVIDDGPGLMSDDLEIWLISLKMRNLLIVYKSVTFRTN
jgi:hypothetical protein